MKRKIDTIVNGFIPPLAENRPVTPQNLNDGGATMLEAGGGLMKKSARRVSQNLQTIAFAFEYLQEIGFSLNAGLKASQPSRDKVPANRMKKSPDIYLEKVGEIIANIQAKAGAGKSIQNPVKPEIYSKENPSENYHLSGATIIIDIDGIKSLPIRQDFAEWVAENPYLAANVMSVAATVGEVNGAGLEGEAINNIINILSKSIKKIGADCRSEKELEEAELSKILKVVLADLKTGYLRELSIKLIKKLMDGSAFSALGFTVGIEVIPTLIKVLKDEITLDEAIAKVGLRMLTAAVITTVVMLIPTVGRSLLSQTVIKAIWEEISPEWKTFLVKKGTDIGSAIATGKAVIAISEVGIIEQQVWQNLSAEKRQAVIEKMKQSTPEQVKIAYNMTLEKAAEAFDIASGWFGERTSELAQSVESATPMKLQTKLKEILDNHQKRVVYKVA
ncbi:hypothetical protein ACL6C3_22660 [Capilliphycus salinus ALCB114379]|uniref:hypothetical protein n=1 Tax=Capilliphycus salinus TaxID=2768948 RepID=UPI0039A65447